MPVSRVRISSSGWLVIRASSMLSLLFRCTYKQHQPLPQTIKQRDGLLMLNSACRCACKPGGVARDGRTNGGQLVPRNNEGKECFDVHGGRLVPFTATCLNMML